MPCRPPRHLCARHRVSISMLSSRPGSGRTTPNISRSASRTCTSGFGARPSAAAPAYADLSSSRCEDRIRRRHCWLSISGRAAGTPWPINYCRETADPPVEPRCRWRATAGAPVASPRPQPPLLTLPSSCHPQRAANRRVSGCQPGNLKGGPALAVYRQVQSPRSLMRENLLFFTHTWPSCVALKERKRRKRLSTHG